jgi:hypothetical protein
VLALIDEAHSLGYQPQDPVEWLTYIEAQAFAGNLEAAQELSNRIQAHDISLHKGLCEIWKRVQAEGPARSDMQERAAQILGDLQCGP